MTIQDPTKKAKEVLWSTEVLHLVVTEYCDMQWSRSTFVLFSTNVLYFKCKFEITEMFVCAGVSKIVREV